MISIQKKLTSFFLHHRIARTVIPIVLFFVALASMFGVWAINKYWFPPYQTFTRYDVPQKIIIHTNIGQVTIVMETRSIFPVAHFTQLVRDGFYSGTRIHRIVPSLLIEGGDPLTKKTEFKSFWGLGGLGNAFKNEIHSFDTMTAGTVALTGSGAGTFGSQFFIVTKDTPWLVGHHTVIGYISEGMEVVKAIEEMPHTATGLPERDVILQTFDVYE